MQSPPPTSPDLKNTHQSSPITSYIPSPKPTIKPFYPKLDSFWGGFNQNSKYIKGHVGLILHLRHLDVRTDRIYYKSMRSLVIEGNEEEDIDIQHYLEPLLLDEGTYMYTDLGYFEEYFIKKVPLLRYYRIIKQIRQAKKLKFEYNPNSNNEKRAINIALKNIRGVQSLHLNRGRNLSLVYKQFTRNLMHIKIDFLDKDWRSKMTHLMSKCPNLISFGKFKITANKFQNPIKTNFLHSFIKTKQFKALDLDLTSYDSPFFHIMEQNDMKSIKIDLPMMNDNLTKTFECFESLRSLELKPRNPVASEAYDLLVDGLISLKQLRSFTFKYTLGQGNGDQFIEVLEKSLPQMNYLENLSIDFYLQDGPNRVMEQLFHTLCTLNYLKTLELIVTGYPDFSSKDNQPLDIDLFQNLEGLKELQRVSISYDSKMDENSIRSIVRVLPRLEKLDNLELSLERMFISKKSVKRIQDAFWQQHRFKTLRFRFAALNLSVPVEGMIRAMMKAMRTDDMLIKICFINSGEDGGGSSFGQIFSKVELVRSRQAFSDKPPEEYVDNAALELNGYNDEVD